MQLLQLQVRGGSGAFAASATPAAPVPGIAQVVQLVEGIDAMQTEERARWRSQKDEGKDNTLQPVTRSFLARLQAASRVWGIKCKVCCVE